MRKIVSAAVGVAAMALLPMNANAAPIADVDLLSASDIDALKPGNLNPTFGDHNGTGNYFVNVTGDVSSVRKSPWLDDTNPYSAVSGNGSSVLYDLADATGIPTFTGFSFIWGTADPNPEERNLLEFFLADALVYSTNAGVLGMTQNAVYSVAFSNFTFDSVRFTNGANPAFEYANVAATVPLPATALLLISGVGGLAAMRRFRKS